MSAVAEPYRPTRASAQPSSDDSSESKSECEARLTQLTLPGGREDSKEAEEATLGVISRQSKRKERRNVSRICRSQLQWCLTG